MVREYVYIFGAISPMDGQHDSLILPWANTDAMSYFLQEVRDRHPEEYILMFMDQAGWHKAKALKIPPNMELAYLPPYSPELNPQEQVWDEFREKYFGNRLFNSLQAVVDAAAIGLRHLDNQKEKLMSLTKRDWMFKPI